MSAARIAAAMASAAPVPASIARRRSASEARAASASTPKAATTIAEVIATIGIRVSVAPLTSGSAEMMSRTPGAP